MTRLHNSEPTVSISLILFNARNQEVHENYINDFFLKNVSFGENGSFWSQNGVRPQVITYL